MRGYLLKILKEKFWRKEKLSRKSADFGRFKEKVDLVLLINRSLRNETFVTVILLFYFCCAHNESFACLTWSIMVNKGRLTT